MSAFYKAVNWNRQKYIYDGLLAGSVVAYLALFTGVTLLRSAPPIITDLRAWTSRPDSTQLKEERAGIEARLRRPVDS